MPGKKYKSITFNEKIVSRMELTSQKVSYKLEMHLEERRTLRKFASKITKVPETVRVYEELSTKRERERRNET